MLTQTFAQTFTDCSLQDVHGITRITQDVHRGVATCIRTYARDYLKSRK